MMTPRQWVLVILIIVVFAAALVAGTLLIATGSYSPRGPGRRLFAPSPPERRRSQQADP
jgi:hypothetical protein